MTMPAAGGAAATVDTIFFQFFHHNKLRFLRRHGPVMMVVLMAPIPIVMICHHQFSLLFAVTCVPERFILLIRILPLFLLHLLHDLIRLPVLSIQFFFVHLHQFQHFYMLFLFLFFIVSLLCLIQIFLFLLVYRLVNVLFMQQLLLFLFRFLFFDQMFLHQLDLVVVVTFLLVLLPSVIRLVDIIVDQHSQWVQTSLMLFVDLESDTADALEITTGDSGLSSAPLDDEDDEDVEVVSGGDRGIIDGGGRGGCVGAGGGSTEEDVRRLLFVAFPAPGFSTVFFFTFPPTDASPEVEEFTGKESPSGATEGPSSGALSTVEEEVVSQSSLTKMLRELMESHSLSSSSFAIMPAAVITTGDSGLSSAPLDDEDDEDVEVVSGGDRGIIDGGGRGGCVGAGGGSTEEDVRRLLFVAFPAPGFSTVFFFTFPPTDASPEVEEFTGKESPSGATEGPSSGALSTVEEEVVSQSSLTKMLRELMESHSLSSSSFAIMPAAVVAHADTPPLPPTTTRRRSPETDETEEPGDVFGASIADASRGLVFEVRTRNLACSRVRVPIFRLFVGQPVRLMRFLRIEPPPGPPPPAQAASIEPLSNSCSPIGVDETDEMPSPTPALLASMGRVLRSYWTIFFTTDSQRCTSFRLSGGSEPTDCSTSSRSRLLTGRLSRSIAMPSRTTDGGRSSASSSSSATSCAAPSSYSFRFTSSIINILLLYYYFLLRFLFLNDRRARRGHAPSTGDTVQLVREERIHLLAQRATVDVATVGEQRPLELNATTVRGRIIASSPFARPRCRTARQQLVPSHQHRILPAKLLLQERRRLRGRRSGGLLWAGENFDGSRPLPVLLLLQQTEDR
uniref:Uncharacterized protein n=1 Tax=Anopheles atroparvus TaxID=41427 RepID=A0A182JKD5_ANOAO